MLFTVAVIDLVGFGIVIPILPFITPQLGGSETDIALIFGVYSVGVAVAGPWWGRLSDRIGRKRVLMICLLGGAGCYAMIGFATDLWMIYAARTLAGLMAGNLPVATAMMADLSAPTRRAKAMGLIGTAFGVGLILGPLIGGLLAGAEENLMRPFWFAGLMSLLATLLAWRVLPDKAQDPTVHSPSVDDPNVKSDQQPAATPSMPTESVLTHLRRRNLSSLLLQFFLHTAAVSASVYLFPLWVHALLDWGPREVGYFYGVVGVAMIVIQGGMLEWLSDRFGVLPLLRTGAFVFGSSMIAAAFLTQEIGMALVMFIAYSGATLCLPMLNTMASGVVGQSRRGAMMGTTATTSALGRIVGPVATGFILASLDYQWAWLTLAVLVVLVFIWTLTWGVGVAREIHSQPAID